MQNIAAPPAFARAWRQSIAGEITGRVLPFWMTHGFDEFGGITGGLTNDLRPIKAPRSTTLAAELLWAFSRSSHTLRKPEHARAMAQTHATLTLAHIDHLHGGVFEAVDETWQPADDRKFIGTQAMTILALVEFYRASQNAQALAQAQDIFWQMEPCAGEVALDRQWRPITKTNAPEPDRTPLLVLQACAALVAEWRDPAPKRVALAAAQAISQSKNSAKNYALALEASWHVSGFGPSHALGLAQTVLHDGVGKDGVLQDGAGVAEHSWRTQSEGVIGFYNAYQLSGDARFLHASRTCWNVIEQFFVDYSNGEWHKILNKHWQASPDAPKAGAGFGPFHQARMGFEMMARLK